MNNQNKPELSSLIKDADLNLIMQVLDSIRNSQAEANVRMQNHMGDVKKEIKEIHAYLFGGDIISPMGNVRLRQSIVKGVKDALA